MPAITQDLRDLEIPEIATFSTTPGGLPRLDVHSPLATAEIYLHGGHVARFQPTGSAPVLFMSAASHFAAGKPIRGGVPICFPWFGPRAGHPESPMHGFARTKTWRIESLTQSADGVVNVVLALAADDATRAHWSHDFVLRHRIAIGTELRMTLEVENTSATAFTFEEALHTYFAVADVREATAIGLEGASYLDKTDGFKTKTVGAEPLRFTGETDRLFPQHHGTCVIADRPTARRIVIEKSASATTVVWNPWIAKAAAMADFGDDEWPQMLCIETANAGADAVTLAAGARHALTAVVRVE